MRFTKQFICTSAAIGLVFTANLHAAAQETPTAAETIPAQQSPAFIAAERKLSFAEATCWSIDSNDPDFKAQQREKYEIATEEFLVALQNIASADQDALLKEHPYFMSCPPKIVQLDNGGQTWASTVDIFFGGGTTRVKPTQAGYGVKIIPGKEGFVAKTDESLRGSSFSAKVRIAGKYRLGIEYADVNGSSEGHILNGTDAVGMVYHNFAPSGSTGINLGPRGLDVRTDTAASRLRLYFSRRNEGNRFGDRLRAWVAYGGGAHFAGTAHTASVTTPSFNDIKSVSRQEVNENSYYVAANLGLDFGVETPKRGDFALRVMPRLEAGYRTAKLDSQQTNTCGLCGAADRNFTINIKDDDHGFYYVASVSTAFGYYISDDISIGLSASIGSRNKTAKIVNPETGDDLFVRNNPTHLETGREYLDSVNVWFSADF